MPRTHPPLPESRPPDADARRRWALYAVLIAVAVGQYSGRLLAVNSVDRQLLEKNRIDRRLDERRRELQSQGVTEPGLSERVEAYRAQIEPELRIQRPFLSANDRSRWLGIRALVEHGQWHIDSLVQEPGWDSIDKVRHVGPDGQMHYYSSKPPLSYVPHALAYWALNRVTGWSLADEPYLVGRTLLMLTNVPMFALLIAMVAAVAERYCRTDFARLVLVCSIAFATGLTAFVIVLNNHLMAATTAAVALYAWTRIRHNGDLRARWFLLAGVAAALTAANELPALAMLVGVGLTLLIVEARRTLLWFAPGVLVVAAAFFVTNYAAHQSLRPPYMHRDPDNLADNWYLYPGSHWLVRPGIDTGEASRLVYLVHTTVGHHGVFSMTPLWVLTIAGGIAWLIRGDRVQRELALGVLGLSVVVLTFYIGLRPQEDRNYGGMTSGLRWLFWLAPLWVTLMAPALDWAARRRGAQAVVLVLLVFSTLSAAYPTWNPWTQPWIYRWLEWCGYSLLG